MRSWMPRVWAMTSSSTTKDFSGSNPRISLVAATSSAPSLEPWMPPVFCFPGAGYPMIVRRAISEGLAVSAFAARIAA